MSGLSFAAGPTDVPLLRTTLAENLRLTTARVPASDALISRAQGFRATYTELWELVSIVARGLIARGVRRGDRVGLWSPNRYEWVVLQYATARIGAVLVNVNPAYKSSELEYALGKSGVRLLILARGFRQTSYVDLAAEVRPRCPELEETLVLDDEWESLLADGRRVDEADLAAREATLIPTDPINIQYTSGTTGFPKGATLSHTNILNNGFFVGEILRYTERDRVCIPVPFYHCFGMVLGNIACTTHGAAIVIPSEAFDPLAALEAVVAERCTALYGVPTMFIGVLEHPEFASFDVSSLRTGIMAGSPCPVEVMKSVRDRLHMPEVTICYGMTETSPVSAQTEPTDPLEKQVGSVGRVHPHVEVRIVDPEGGEVVSRGKPGELCTRGYSVMIGYYNDPVATASVMDSDGFLHTRDLATMDDDGYVNIVGRIKDMIIRGGENIYPREIEEFLHTHPDVSDVHVIGVPSVKYGEEVMAWVKPREGSNLTSDTIQAYCRGRIATFKIPRFIKVTDELPMTVTGKIQKYKMRLAAIAELGLENVAAIRTA